MANTTTRALMGASSKTALSSALIRADADEGEERKEEKREDADAGKQLETFIADMTKCMDSMSKRMDAMEEESKARKDARKDAEESEAKEEKAEEKKADKKKDAEEVDEPHKPEPVVADKKKDAETEEKAEAKEEAKSDRRKDAEKEEAHADADMVALKAEIADLKTRLTELSPLVQRPRDDDQATRIADAWTKADGVYSALGKKAPNPLPNEDPDAYQRRVARDLKSYSPRYKDANLHAVADSVIFSATLDGIYADALEFARSPAAVPAGHLVARTHTAGGHTITEYAGTSGAWMKPMSGTVTQAVTEILDR